MATERGRAALRNIGQQSALPSVESDHMLHVLTKAVKVPMAERSVPASAIKLADLSKPGEP